jgi:ABC-type nitrate/sulfonate/bicarbonate transport system substrate-binding protein
MLGFIIFMQVLASGAASGAAEAPVVRIDGVAFLGDLPTIVADSRGLFADQGLETVIEYSRSGVRNLQRLRAGEVDFALMALTPVVLDRLADATPGGADDPVILASLLQAHQLIGIVTAPDSGIESSADFAGRRVAVEPGTNSEFAWWLFERFEGIDSEPVQLIRMPTADMTEAMLAGQLDAAVMPEPWATHLEQAMVTDGQKRQRLFDTRNFYVGKWVLVTTRRQVTTREEICQKVLTAYRQAIDFMEREPLEGLSYYTTKIEDTESVDPENWHSVTFDMNLDLSLVAALRQQFHWAQSEGYGSADTPIDVLGLMAPGPLRSVFPKAVHLHEMLIRKDQP